MRRSAAPVVVSAIWTGMCVAGIRMSGRLPALQLFTAVALVGVLVSLGMQYFTRFTATGVQRPILGEIPWSEVNAVLIKGDFLCLRIERREIRVSLHNYSNPREFASSVLKLFQEHQARKTSVQGPQPR